MPAHPKGGRVRGFVGPARGLPLAREGMGPATTGPALRPNGRASAPPDVRSKPNATAAVSAEIDLRDIEISLLLIAYPPLAGFRRRYLCYRSHL